MPKRDIASFFNSLPKKQKTERDDQLALDTTKRNPRPSLKGQQKRLTPKKVSMPAINCRDVPHSLAQNFPAFGFM